MVRSEMLFQEAQASKRKASEAFELGDLQGGKDLLRAASEDLDLAMAAAPDEAREDLAREAKEISGMYDDADRVGTNHMSKRTRASFHRESTKRGRRHPNPSVEEQ